MKKRKIYKTFMLATTPFAFLISCAAAGIGAALQGLLLWFMLAVSIGGFLYVYIVFELLNLLEKYERTVNAYNIWSGRGKINYR